MTLISRIAGMLPDSARRQLRHGHYLATGKRPLWHYEVDDREQFFRKAMRMLAFNGISGDYAEFGCHGGTTFAMAHRNAKIRGGARHQWAFDSFSGLPPAVDGADAHPIWVAGEMATSLQDFRAACRRQGISDEEYSVVEGYYDVTLRPDAPGPRPTDLAMVYVDCDLFSSTECVFDFIRPLMKHGMLIAFDDYFCHSATVISGERAAMLEYLAGEDRFEFLPYHAYGWHGMSFIVEGKAQVERHRSPKA